MLGEFRVAPTRIRQLFDAGRPEILDRFAQRLTDRAGPNIDETDTVAGGVAFADRILADCLAQIDGLQPDGAPPGSGPASAPSWQEPAGRLPDQRELGRCAALLFEVVLEAGVALVAAEPAQLPDLSTALGLLNRSLMTCVQVIGAADDDAARFAITERHRDEHRQLARLIHDQIGSGLGLALRQVELAELHHSTEPERARDKLGQATRTLTVVLRTTRELVSDLAQLRPSVSLREDIEDFVKSMDAPDTAVTVSLTGDQFWAPEAYRHEVFVMVRECLHNVFRHARAQQASVRIEVTEAMLHAVVDDDGIGIRQPPGVRRRAGYGLISLRERAEALGGAVSVAARDPRGTRVEIWLPLPRR